MRRSIFARVKFLSRLFTALNLLPSIATLTSANKSRARQSMMNRAHTLRMASPLSLRKSAIVLWSGTRRGAIYVFDELEQLFRLRATYGFSEDLIAAVQDQHFGASDAIRQATQARQPQEIADIRDEPPSPVREIAMRAGYRARLIVPLVSADKVVGALVIRRTISGRTPLPSTPSAAPPG
jgi:transcriptional regulator with GAF, ATPase, and Fis domain